MPIKTAHGRLVMRCSFCFAHWNFVSRKGQPLRPGGGLKTDSSPGPVRRLRLWTLFPQVRCLQGALVLHFREPPVPRFRFRERPLLHFRGLFLRFRMASRLPPCRLGGCPPNPKAFPRASSTVPAGSPEPGLKQARPRPWRRKAGHRAEPEVRNPNWQPESPARSPTREGPPVPGGRGRRTGWRRCRA